MGIRKFKTELKFANKNLNLLHGAPAPYRSQAITAVGGTHVGTAFVSSLPSRRIQMYCPEEVWNQARCTLGTFLCNNTWIHGAVMYGFAHKAHSPEVRQATDQLLEVATTHIVHNLKGPRFIMGDFNQVAGILQQPQLWEKLGWREAQSLQQERYGSDIAKTCKQSSTKDFIWLSPELVQAFQKAEVIDHVYPDHGALIAHFSPIGEESHVYHWRKPMPISWDECQGHIASGQFQLPSQCTPDECSSLIAQEFENRVHQHLIHQAQPGLLPQQRGRSQTLETQKMLCHSKPIKPSRNGDLQPEFQGHNLQHQRWFTQLRRLESLARLYKSAPWNHNQFVHATREWRAVLTAPGFSDFRQWWTKLPNKLANAPVFLPTQLPDEQTLNAVSITLHAEVRRYEKLLQADLLAKAKHNRVMFPNKVFKDFAKPAVSPVCILQDSAQSRIIEVDETDCSITLDKPNAFWSGELIGNQGPFEPIVSCEDKMWLQSVEGFAVGQNIRQEKFVGQLEEMFARFQSEWQTRWDRHLNIPSDQWDPLISFFQLAKAPGAEQPYVPITPERWIKSLRSKKSTAAQGPDGWTRSDLLKLPHDLTCAILRIIHQVETGNMQWPRQWLVGIVHSLEKHEQPAAVTGYRPITIFSLIYNVPHRCTTNMWMTLQQVIEGNFSSGLPTNGAVLDIIKCFNHLPRIPIFGILRHMGAAPPVLHAWHLALTMMERRFAIRGSVGQALKSSTGCAEGDSLSVVGMVAINEFLAQWMLRKAPQVRLISFVDNLELFSSDPHALLTSTRVLEEALALLDLQVDKNKTYLWSTQGSFRKLFIQHGYNVKTAARDVGAHLQYNRVATNFTITQKIESFKDRWKSLALSPATYHQKLRAAKVVAWPNMLHGISSAHLGDPWYEDMRTALLRALGEHKPGCSPPLHLSLFEFPSADPGYYAFWTTILQTVFWQWDEAGFFRDVWGVPVDLWEAPIQELAVRATEAWRYRVACECASRHTFAGLAQCDAGFSTECLPTHARDKAILRCAMNGTFFTADHLKYRDTPGDTRCHLCLQEDSLFHRNWECAALDKCRKHLSKEQREALLSMTPATFLQGWFPLPSRVHVFRKRLRNLPEYHECFVPYAMRPIMCTKGPTHFFTDGACLRPKDRFARLCSWGVTRSTPDDMWSFCPVASGCLPGRHQTVVRAEITAATAALRAAAQEGHALCIWSDNQRTVTALQMLMSDPHRHWSPKAANHDLLNQMAGEFREVSHLCRGVFKVSSHQKVTGSTSAAERWCFAGNETADVLAARAFQAEPDLMKCWTLLCSELDYMRELRQGFHKPLVEVGLECLTKSTKPHPIKPAESAKPASPLPMTEWVLPDDLPMTAQQYVIPETSALLAWIHELHDSTKPVQRWSWWQLFLDAWKPKCVVASSALPSKVLPLVDGVVGVKGARVVGELIDLSQGEVTLANGRRVRCCTAQDARASVLVEPSKQENLLDGTALAGLHRLGSFNNKKCKGLLGKTYHSWDKWAGNRCVVMSQDIPADILEVLKWNEEEEKEEEEEEAEPVQSEPEPVPEQPVPEPEPEPPTQPPQPTPQPTSWHLNVRVVSATTSHIIRGAAVRLLKEDRSILFTGTSDDGGWVAFQVPRSVEKVVVDIEAEGFDPNSRLYKWDHPNGRSDCGGRENCMTQMALNPVFR
eukprot:s627_g38.t1